MINQQDTETQQPVDQKRLELIGGFQNLIQITPLEDLPQLLADRHLALEEQYMEIIQENRRLKERITTDTLVTSVLSHGHFLNVLESEVRETERMPEPNSILVGLDLDNFKLTNEMLGHKTADQLLITVGEVIAKTIRPGDSPGRTGGDEFSIILRRTTLQDALEIAHRIRNHVTGVIQERFSKEGFSQTISTGLCLIPRGASADKIRDVADAACYTVKHNGRNQIAIGEINPQTGAIETSIVPLHNQPT